MHKINLTTTKNQKANMTNNLLHKLLKKAHYFYKLTILRDPFLLTAKKWFNDNGDNTLRLSYNLTPKSIVFDVGGYIGDYTEEIYKKFKCQIYLFEPITSFFNKCEKRFYEQPSIKCFNFGLSSESGRFTITLDDNRSSFNRTSEKRTTQEATIRSISETINELKIDSIDLIKINIEGGEYDLLPEIIKSGLIKKIRYLQIQFHHFAPNAKELRNKIRNELNKTHKEMWNYEFIWESWEIK